MYSCHPVGEWSKYTTRSVLCFKNGVDPAGFRVKVWCHIAGNREGGISSAARVLR